MTKAFIVLALIFLGQSTLITKLPDAIRCGNDNSEYRGAIYIIHSVQQYKIAHYCQIYYPELRCVSFSLDGGSYLTGLGHYENRKGCENKSLATLDKEGRTIYYERESSEKNQKKLDD